MNLQDIVDDLNNSITRLIGMKPATAILKDVVFALPSKIPKHRLVGKDEECLPSGTLVRYLLDNSDYKGGRRRATDPIWSTKIFIIESMTVKSRQPVMYRLADMDNEQSIPKRYFVLMFWIEKSLIISLMMELFLYDLGWHTLSFAYSMLRISSIITRLKD